MLRPTRRKFVSENDRCYILRISVRKRTFCINVFYARPDSSVGLKKNFLWLHCRNNYDTTDPFGMISQVRTVNWLNTHQFIV